MDLETPLEKQSCGYTSNSSHGSRALVWAMFLLLGVTAWARGGSSDITPWLQFVLASIVVVVFLWEVLAGDFKGFCGGIFRDPVLYTGAGILVLLGIQWMNSGRDLYYDSAAGTWLYSDPPRKHLPYAFNAQEAMQVWIWFYCALVVAVLMRSSLISRRGVYRLWKFLIINSCLLGLFGMVQYLSGTDKIFWIHRLPYQRFFASFGYSNHAGSFFLLMMFLSGSMFVRRVFRHNPPRFTMRTFLLLVAVILNLICANMTLSRYAIAASWAGAVAVAVYVCRRLWRRGSPAVKLNVSIVLICCGLLAIYGSFSLAGAMLGKELTTFLRLNDEFLGAGRLQIFRAGLSVWQDSPVFGVGPWGFRHLVGLHLDESLYFMLLPGTANLHNDGLQYLVESGIVGFGLICSAGIVLLSRFRFRVLRNWMPGVLLLAGVAAIAAQSMFDLPMRNPAIFYCWLAILAGAGKISWEKASERKGQSKRIESSEAVSSTERKPTS